jgi:hypothetical protein
MLPSSTRRPTLRLPASVDGIATAHPFQVDMEYLAFLC